MHTTLGNVDPVLEILQIFPVLKDDVHVRVAERESIQQIYEAAFRISDQSTLREDEPESGNRIDDTRNTRGACGNRAVEDRLDRHVMNDIGRFFTIDTQQRAITAPFANRIEPAA